jgi:hypothetical protein
MSVEANPDFSNVDDLIPDDCTPLQSWRIVKFLDAEGEERFNWTCEGDPRISDTAGMIAVVQFDAMHRLSVMGHEVEDEDDDG